MIKTCRVWIIFNRRFGYNGTKKSVRISEKPKVHALYVTKWNKMGFKDLIM